MEHNGFNQEGINRHLSHSDITDSIERYKASTAVAVAIRLRRAVQSEKRVARTKERYQKTTSKLAKLALKPLVMFNDWNYKDAVKMPDIDGISQYEIEKFKDEQDFLAVRTVSAIKERLGKRKVIQLRHSNTGAKIRLFHKPPVQKSRTLQPGKSDFYYEVSIRLPGEEVADYFFTGECFRAKNPRYGSFDTHQQVRAPGQSYSYIGGQDFEDDVIIPDFIPRLIEEAEFEKDPLIPDYELIPEHDPHLNDPEIYF